MSKTKVFPTPKTLERAIENGLTESFDGDDSVPNLIQSHVLDYLRQKFTTAYLRATPEQLVALKALAQKIGNIEQEQME